MYNIIKRYCENEFTNGLMLLDMPTGSGKTYSVIKYIFDAVQDVNNSRRFFFITTLKKNLPENDIKRFFEKEEKLVDDGILDSFDIVSIVAELCEEYDVTITVDMLEPENFNSASAMLALIDQLLDEQ